MPGLGKNKKKVHFNERNLVGSASFAIPLVNTEPKTHFKVDDKGTQEERNEAYLRALRLDHPYHYLVKLAKAKAKQKDQGIPSKRVHQVGILKKSVHRRLQPEHHNGRGQELVPVQDVHVPFSHVADDGKLDENLHQLTEWVVEEEKRQARIMEEHRIEESLLQAKELLQQYEEAGIDFLSVAKASNEHEFRNMNFVSNCDDFLDLDSVSKEDLLAADIACKDPAGNSTCADDQGLPQLHMTTDREEQEWDLEELDHLNHIMPNIVHSDLTGEDEWTSWQANDDFSDDFPCSLDMDSIQVANDVHDLEDLFPDLML